MTIAEALREAAGRLAAVADTARLDAELLMAHALKVTRSELLLRHMPAPVPDGFARLVERRERHEPVAYITGLQEFYGLELEVSPAVLIPRADSESLIEAAREAFAERAPERIVDLGTGSGALLLAALAVWPQARGTGVDRDPAALQVARGNAGRTDIGPERARFVESDWRVAGWAEALGRFDLVLCNPPYVEADAPLAPAVREWEPAGALFAGPEGLDDYRALLPQLPALMTASGVAVVEIGATQAGAVSEMARHCGLAAGLRRDLGGRPRALILRLGVGKQPANH